MTPEESALVKQAIKETQDGDPRLFIESLFVVATKQNTLSPLRFNRLQDRLWGNLTGRDYFIKFRQGGSSLVQLARATANAMCFPYYNAAVVTLSTDHGRTKERLFRHVHRFIDNIPEEIRPDIGRERADYIEFVNNQSQLYIGTVGSKEFGRSETINFLMVTEFGSFTESEAIGTLTSAVESVVPGGVIIFETTPKTVGSAAHRFYMECKNGTRPYKAHFAPWWWAEDYYLPAFSNEALPADQGPIEFTDEEARLAKLFEDDGISAEDRIRWRRAKLADRKEYFFSEYPEDEFSCWLAATQTVFPADRLRAMMQDIRDPIERDGPIRIYKERSDFRRYVIGLDAAGGITGGDFSAAVVQCVETGEVVAVMQGLIGDNELARTVADLSLRYSHAMVGGERDQWTAPIMEKLDHLGVPMFIEEDGKLGFANTNTSRMQGIASLRTAIREADWWASDGSLLEELVQYQRITDVETKVEKYGAPKGLHDDLCVAAQRAQQMRLTVPGQGVFYPRLEVGANVSTYSRPVLGW